MSGTIAEEACFWLYAACLGMQLMLIYDLLRIFRRVIPHRNAFIGVEDFCYWLFCGCMIFKLLYSFNHGVIRWFVVMGMSVGMLLYHCTASQFFVTNVSRLLKTILRLLKRPFSYLLAIIRRIFSHLNGNVKKVTKSLKNKLKRQRKDCNIRMHRRKEHKIYKRDRSRRQWHREKISAEGRDNN